MPSPTERLVPVLRALSTGNFVDNFKESAMALVKEGADIKVRSEYGAGHTLLHILVLQNKKGVNNVEIAELIRLDPEVLKTTNYYEHTVLQVLLDAFAQEGCSFADFKQTAMLLARNGADIILKGRENQTLLHMLVLQNKKGVNNAEIVEMIQLNKICLIPTDFYNRTPLQALLDAFIRNACSFDDLKQTAMLLARQGADITQQSRSGRQETLLHILVRTNANGVNNAEIAELVALNIAILTSTDLLQRTPLQASLDGLAHKICSFADFKQTAMVLARLGGDITLKSNYGEQTTLLHLLVLHNVKAVNNAEIVELLKLNKANLSSKDDTGRTPLQALLDDFQLAKCTFDDFKQTVLTLAQQGDNLALQGTVGERFPVLHILVLNGFDNNKKEISELIKLNQKVLDFTDGFGCTPVHTLLIHASTALPKTIEPFLTESNLHAKDNYDVTLLHVACYAGNLPVAQYLREKGLSLTALTTRKETLIHQAVWATNSTYMVAWLIETGAIDINAQDIFGDTALHLATQQHNSKLIALLVAKGASLTLRNNGKQTAADVAMEKGYFKLAASLFDPKEELLEKIQAMHDYGIELRDQGASKGQVAIDLAKELAGKTEAFFAKEPAERNFEEFKKEFTQLLHSKDKEMSAYRVSWGTIITNIGIALTGIGVLIIAAKLLHSRLTEGRALFFNQKSKTTSEEKIEDVEQILQQIPR